MGTNASAKRLPSDEAPSGGSRASLGGGYDARPRPPIRSMNTSQQATLHAALAQMTAVLRVAKESETKLRKDHSAKVAEAEELKRECNAWRMDSDRLWGQVKELQATVGQGQGSNTML